MLENEVLKRAFAMPLTSPAFAPVGDPPLIQPSGRPLPIVGPVKFVSVVDLQHLGRVFDRKFFRAGE